jgi:hypothetical protein
MNTDGHGFRLSINSPQGFGLLQSSAAFPLRIADAKAPEDWLQDAGATRPLHIFSSVFIRDHPWLN